MGHDETKPFEKTDVFQSIVKTSKQYRHLPKRKCTIRSRCCSACKKNENTPGDISNKLPSKCKDYKKTNRKNKLIYQYYLEQFIHKFSSEARLFSRFKAFILVTLFVVHNLSCAVGIRTAWVRQSLASFDVEDEFHRFVEATGGNREKFSFDGNFFSSPEKADAWDQPLDSSSFGKRLKLDTQNQKLPHPPEMVVPTILHDEEIRVPRSFYIDIFDSSLPVDSPHQKSLRTSRLPRPAQQSLPSFDAKMQLSVTKSPYLFSRPQQSFSNSFLSTSVPQKFRRLKNFTFQSLGRKNFSNGEVSDKRKIALNSLHKPIKNPVDGGSIKFEPKPIGINNALVKKVNASLGIVQHKPSVPIFTSTFYQRPGGQEPAMGTVSLNFPPSPGKKSVQFGKSTGVNGDAVNRSSENRAKSGSPTGCVDKEGIFRRQRERWFGRDCTRHTCVVFRSRHFIETDSCESEIRNTSYRCFVVADEKADYPQCCPRFKCHPDNLGRPDEPS
ncbi:hypothetical protein FHG87_010125 [Trinorchestia longiramus]|nr:hypothetical protein FHG87_010125 [Trinorchestia longiramus]